MSIRVHVPNTKWNFLSEKVTILSIPHVAMLIPCVYSGVGMGRGEHGTPVHKLSWCSGRLGFPIILYTLCIIMIFPSQDLLNNCIIYRISWSKIVSRADPFPNPARGKVFWYSLVRFMSFPTIHGEQYFTCIACIAYEMWFTHEFRAGLLTTI